MKRSRVEKPSMERAFSELREGTISFEAFERATKTDWDRLATMLWKRWPLPAGVEVADVRQELLIAAVVRKYGAKPATGNEPAVEGKTLLESWDPAKGAPLARFVTWNAVVWACRWIHDQRGVYKSRENRGSRGRDLGNVPRPISSYEREDGSNIVHEAAVLPVQGEARAFEEMVEAVISKLRSSRDRQLLGIYLDTGGSVEEAARILAQDGRLGMTARTGAQAVHETLQRTRLVTRRVMAMQQAAEV